VPPPFAIESSPEICIKPQICDAPVIKPSGSGLGPGIVGLLSSQLWTGRWQLIFQISSDAFNERHVTRSSAFFAHQTSFISNSMTVDDTLTFNLQQIVFEFMQTKLFFNTLFKKLEK